MKPASRRRRMTVETGHQPTDHLRSLKDGQVLSRSKLVASSVRRLAWSTAPTRKTPSLAKTWESSSRGWESTLGLTRRSPSSLTTQQFTELGSAEMQLSPTTSSSFKMPLTDQTSWALNCSGGRLRALTTSSATTRERMATKLGINESSWNAALKRFRASLQNWLQTKVGLLSKTLFQFYWNFEDGRLLHEWETRWWCIGSQAKP